MSIADKDITHLIQLLQQVDNDSSILLDPSNTLVNKIIDLATTYLTIYPEVDLYRKRVQEAGYPVFPGEVDRFGWLTAYFQLKRGIILFG